MRAGQARNGTQWCVDGVKSQFSEFVMLTGVFGRNGVKRCGRGVWCCSISAHLIVVLAGLVVGLVSDFLELSVYTRGACSDQAHGFE